MSRKSDKIWKHFGQLSKFVSHFCKRAAKQACPWRQRKNFYSIKRQKDRVTATVQLQGKLPKKAHKQVWKATSASASRACWRATTKAVRWLSEAGLLNAAELRTYAELVANCPSSRSRHSRQAQPADAPKRRNPPPQPTQPHPQPQPQPAAQPAADGVGGQSLQPSQEAEDGQHEYTDLADKLTRLQLMLGHRFEKLKLLTTALLLFDKTSKDHHFRQLAFLGDSVLGTAAAMEGRRLCPEGSPTEAHHHRAQRVSREACARYALLLDLQAILPQPAGRSTLAESFEAVLGAIFVDAGETTQGMKKVADFYEQLIQFFPLQHDTS